MNLLKIYQYKDILVFSLVMIKIISDINILIKTLLILTNKTVYLSIFTILKHTRHQLENLYYIYIIKPRLEEEYYKEQINMTIICMFIIISSNNYYNNQKLIKIKEDYNYKLSEPLKCIASI